MKKNITVIKASAFALLTSSSAFTFAAGFQVNEHSTNGLGRAMAGQAAIADNASVLATNPAAITLFDSAQLSASISYINPEMDIKGEITTNLAPISVDGSINDVADPAVVPALFFTSPINNQWSYGVGLYTTYGLTSDYGDDFNGVHFANKSEVLSFTINPALAYQLHDTLSIGFGMTFTYSDAQIGTSTPQIIESLTGGAVPGKATIVKMQGDDWASSWNAGLLWQITASTDFALSYRAKTELIMDGHIESDLVPTYNQKGQLALDFAAVTELAVNHKLNSKWSVQASANLTEWSAFDKLQANLEDGSEVLLKDENFDDSWRLSTGVTFQASDDLTLRFGYAQDQGAVTDEHRSLSIPDTDRQWFSTGLTYQTANSWQVDAAYVYIKGDDATVNETSTIGSIVSNLDAIQYAEAHIFSLQINTAF